MPSAFFYIEGSLFFSLSYVVTELFSNEEAQLFRIL